MILKASDENGALSSDLRVISTVSSSTSTPFTSGTSTGDGSSWITPSSMACTPLFLKAEPQYIGTISVARVRVRSALMRSEEHTSELQSQSNLVCRLLLEKKKKQRVVLTYSS